MRSIQSLLIGILFCPLIAIAQTPIDVAENTFKIGGLGAEIVYYGLAEGDQLIFSFEEKNGKELKEVEIIEMPESSRFMDYKTKKIENKTLQIQRTGIYKFRFSNSALGGRICKYKIQRIPASEQAKAFNTNVYWKTVSDTSYITVQERYLMKSDTIIHNLTDQVAKVHSQGNANGNKTIYNFTLPENTVSWSYYVGVDQAGQQAFDKAVKQLAANSRSLIPGYGPMAALALNSVSYLTAMQGAEDIDYYIVDPSNVVLLKQGAPFYTIKSNKVINDFSRMQAPLKGNYYMCLVNDNAITGVSVTVKITAIAINQQWGTRPIQKMNIKANQVAYLKN